mgnify:CR=1 FL=1
MAKKKKEDIVLNNFHPQAYLMYLAGLTPKGDTLAKSKMSPKTSPLGVHKVKDSGPTRDTVTKIYNSKNLSLIHI